MLAVMAVLAATSHRELDSTPTFANSIKRLIDSMFALPNIRYAVILDEMGTE